MGSRTFRARKFCFGFQVPEPHERALSLLGVPFRPQGRDPETGLDCIGLVLCVFQISEARPPDYRLTDGSWERLEREMNAWFVPIADTRPKNGNVAIFRLRRSFHFGVISGPNLVHADLSIGKVAARRLPTVTGRDCRLYQFRGSK